MPNRILPGVHGIGFDMPEDFPRAAGWSTVANPRLTLKVRWSDQADPPGPAAGEKPVYISQAVNGSRVEVYDSGDAYRLIFPGICELSLAKTLDRLELPRAKVEKMEVIPLLLAGTIVAFVLSLAGLAVIHASAVLRRGHLLAFVGETGWGKSSLAAGFALTGADVFTDDVLAIDATADSVLCASGSNSLRLRPGAVQVVRQRWPDARLDGPTEDGRWLLSRGKSVPGLAPLGALIVLAEAPPGASQYELSPLRQADALMELTVQPRTFAFRIREVLARDFHGLGIVARSVPCYRLSFPSNRSGILEDFPQIAAVIGNAIPSWRDDH